MMTHQCVVRCLSVGANNHEGRRCRHGGEEGRGGLSAEARGGRRGGREPGGHPGTCFVRWRPAPAAVPGQERAGVWRKSKAPARGGSGSRRRPGADWSCCLAAGTSAATPVTELLPGSLRLSWREETSRGWGRKPGPGAGPKEQRVMTEKRP